MTHPRQAALLPLPLTPAAALPSEVRIVRHIKYRQHHSIRVVFDGSGAIRAMESHLPGNLISEKSWMGKAITAHREDLWQCILPAALQSKGFNWAVATDNLHFKWHDEEWSV
jgi:hypothetical protein